VSLEQLIERCKQNETQAQSQIYKLFANKLYSVCLKYSRNRAEAEDNLQDAFITIFNKVNQYKNRGSFEGWAKRITVNTALQRYRSPGVFDIINEEQIQDVSVEIDEDTISLDYLLEIIQGLPDRYRLVFNLYAMDDYSHKEIAKMLGISIGTSKSNLARARLILKEKIEKHKANNSSQSL